MAIQTLLSARRHTPKILGKVALFAALVGPALVGFALSSPVASASTKSTVIKAVGAENEYANVLSQIGGKYVSVTSILNNPNVDPHAYEASPSIAVAVSQAQLVVQNGVGYDGFMNNIEAASPNPRRKVIVAQHVLGLADNTPNPHLWYDPKTMPAVATAMTNDLAALRPSHRAYFQRNLATFKASLQPWLNAIASFKATHKGTRVAVTEPVADYLLKAMGAKMLTPFVFQADIMNGVDPSPEDITLEESLFTKHQAQVFLYNQQVVSSVTVTVRQSAVANHVPVVGVYETMPTPGYDYQTWMLAEVNAIRKAVVSRTSTKKL
ncbi:MAG TPA: zinc ABC transporter substrate-binding protein [Acidimicrobiales bacterium]|nr:zinc ABC transporter substrate-binding protein [Acidimicrobiales bacterium]